MPQSPTRYVGWDVHIETMAVAYVANDHSAEVVYHGTSGTRPCDLDTRIPHASVETPASCLRLRG